MCSQYLKPKTTPTPWRLIYTLQHCFLTLLSLWLWESATLWVEAEKSILNSSRSLKHCIQQTQLVNYVQGSDKKQKMLFSLKHQFLVKLYFGILATAHCCSAQLSAPACSNDWNRCFAKWQSINHHFLWNLFHNDLAQCLVMSLKNLKVTNPPLTTSSSNPLHPFCSPSSSPVQLPLGPGGCPVGERWTVSSWGSQFPWWICLSKRRTGRRGGGGGGDDPRIENP